MVFEQGDVVVYNPSMPLPPLRDRPCHVYVVYDIVDEYVMIRRDCDFLVAHGYIHDYSHNAHSMSVLKLGITHHPWSEKSVKYRFKKALPEIRAAVEARVAALVFSQKTGITGCRGFGPTDTLRSFLDPRPRRPRFRPKQTSKAL